MKSRNHEKANGQMCIRMSFNPFTFNSHITESSWSAVWELPAVLHSANLPQTHFFKSASCKGKMERSSI